MELIEVAEIQPGMPFRSRIETEARGEVAVIQARDLGSDGRVRLDGAARLHSLPASPRRGFLQAGDILFQPRGTRFPAAVYEWAKVPAVAAAPLWVLRADRSRIVPEFLVALLMSPDTQAILRQTAAGTYVPQVPREAIERLRIELPDLSSQGQLAGLARLARRERELTDRLREMRARLFDLAVKEVVKKARKRGNAPGP